MNLSREKLRRLVQQWRNDVVQFIADVFDEKPSVEQEKILRAVQRSGRVAVRSGHGTGKTYLATRCALWFFTCFPRSKVLVTAPTWRQIEKVFFAELSSAVHLSFLSHIAEFTRCTVRMKVRRKAEWVPAEYWFITGIASDQPENFQGFHSKHLLCIMDEASGVPQPVWESMESNRATGESKMLAIGNPTRRYGMFYRIFSENIPGWVRFHLSSINSPFVSQQWLEEKKREWGEHSNLYRVRVLGEFPLEEEQAVFPVSALEDVQRIPSDIFMEPSAVFVGVDVARFGDCETAVSIVCPVGGNLVLVNCQTFSHTDIPTTVERLEQILSLYDVQAVYVDDTGVGGGVTDFLQQKYGEKVSGVNFGGSAEERKYVNLRAQWTFWLKDVFLRRLFSISEVIEEKIWEKLVAQSSQFQWELTAAGKIRVTAAGRRTDAADSLILSVAAALSASGKTPKIFLLEG